MKITMKDVMTANCQIPHAEMLTSNHCAALARELTAMFEAPVPPAGDVEVRSFFAKEIDFDDGPVECVLAGDYRAHVARLTAERDSVDAELILMRDAEKLATESLWQTQSELTKALEELRIEKVASAAMHKQAEDFKTLSWERRQELIKARDMVRWFYTHANVHQVGTVMMDAARDFLAHQSAPAAKGESDEC